MREQSGREGGEWTWQKGDLLDSDGRLFARVRANVLELREDRVLLETLDSRLMFRARATTASGEVMLVRRPQLTVSLLEARCGEQAYRLERTSFWSRERVITTSDGQIIAVARPLKGGDLRVTSGDAEHVAPLLHVVFLTWVCWMVDARQDFRR